MCGLAATNQDRAIRSAGRRRVSGTRVSSLRLARAGKSSSSLRLARARNSRSILSREPVNMNSVIVSYSDLLKYVGSNIYTGRNHKRLVVIAAALLLVFVV